MNVHVALCSRRTPRESYKEDSVSDEPKVPDESETWCAELAEEDSTEPAGKSGQGGFQHQAEEQGGNFSGRRDSLPKARFLHRGKKVFHQTLHSSIHVV